MSVIFRCTYKTNVPPPSRVDLNTAGAENIIYPKLERGPPHRAFFFIAVVKNSDIKVIYDRMFKIIRVFVTAWFYYPEFTTHSSNL